MDLFEILFPESESAQLKRLANKAKIASERSGDQRRDIDALQEESRQLRACLTAIIETLVERGLIDAGEIQQKIMSMLPPSRDGTDETGESPVKLDT